MFEAYDVTGQESLAASYNVAPTDPVHLVRTASEERKPVTGGDAGRRVVCVARWGLLPPWAKSPSAGARMINARAETVRTSRAYRGPFASRRCLVPADGWYEWRSRPDGRGKQAYYLTPEDGRVLTFAGLWQPWGPGRLLTSTVLTTQAVGDLATIHERMPVVLPADRWPAWLDGGPTEAAEVLDSVVGERVPGIELRPVGPAVGNVRNNSSALIKLVIEAQPTVDSDNLPNQTLF